MKDIKDLKFDNAEYVDINKAIDDFIAPIKKDRAVGHWIPNRTPSMDSDWRRKKVSYKIYRCSECVETAKEYESHKNK